MRSISEVIENIEKMSLDRRSQALFDYLVSHPNEIITKNELLAHAWAGQIVHENSLHQAITRLRRALGDDGATVETIYGQGYRFNVVDRTADEQMQTLGANASQPKPTSKTAILVLALLSLLILGGGIWSVTRPASSDSDVSGLLADEILVKADPYSGSDYDPAIRKLVEQVSPQIDTRFAADPKIREKLHHRIGDIRAGWGDYRQSAVHMRQSVTLSASLYGQRSAEYAAALISLCEIERMGGELGAAAEHCGQVLNVTSSLEGDIVTKARIAQAKLDFETGAYSKTEQALSEILSKPDAATMPRNLLAESLWFSALASRKLGFMDRSRAHFQKLIALREKHWGAKHPLTAWAYSDLAELLIEMRLFDAAQPLLQKAIPIFHERLGPDHPDACSPVYAVALIDIAKERWRPAISKLEKCQKVFVARLGADHFWSLFTASQLSIAHAGAGQARIAKELLADTQARARATLYGKPEKSAYFEMLWAVAAHGLREDRAAATHIRNARQFLRELNFPASHPWQKRLSALEENLDTTATAEAGHKVDRGV